MSIGPPRRSRGQGEQMKARANRVHPSGTRKKSLIRVGSEVLACIKASADPNGTCVFERQVMKMKIGYVRVSTQDQNTARQEVLMRELGGR